MCSRTLKGPFQGARREVTINQGLRSLHSLNPWLFSYHAFGVTRLLYGARLTSIVQIDLWLKGKGTPRTTGESARFWLLPITPTKELIRCWESIHSTGWHYGSA